MMEEALFDSSIADEHRTFMGAILQSIQSVDN